MSVDERVVFRSRAAQALTFAIWLLATSPIVYFIAGVFRDSRPRLVVSIVIGALDGIIGGLRCSRIELCLDREFVSYRNPLRDHEYPSAAISSVVLKRFGSHTAVDDEVVARLPRGLAIYGVRLPAVAFRLHDGRVTPGATATAFVGRKARTELLGALAAWTARTKVAMEIDERNRGGLGGLLWDVRSGRGTVPGT